MKGGGFNWGGALEGEGPCWITRRGSAFEDVEIWSESWIEGSFFNDFLLRDELYLKSCYEELVV